MCPKGHIFPKGVRDSCRGSRDSFHVEPPSFLFVNRDNKQQLLFPKKLWHCSGPMGASTLLSRSLLIRGERDTRLVASGSRVLQPLINTIRWVPDMCQVPC